MANETRRSAAIARLADCVTVKIDGRDVRVPVAAAENKVLNCLVVSRARTLVEDQLKRYADAEVTLTPRELKDIIEAVAKMSEASATVYSQLEGTLGDSDKAKPKTGDPVADAEPVTEVTDFGALKTPEKKD
jgi:hypothetical protein